MFKILRSDSNQRKLALLSIAALMLMPMTLLSCQTSPTGRQQILLIPAEEVDTMGVQAFQEMKTKQPIDQNQSDNVYVKCVADAITLALGESGPWEVVVFQSEEINAFALPGGKIGVYTGLLKVANTPDQLGAVLGHEVGHVVAQHGRERMSQQLATQGLLTVASSMFKTRETATYQIVMAGLGLGAQVGVLLPFGRAQESEADLIGLQLMAKAGFDPRQSVTLWQNMAKAGGAQPPQILSTHPSHETRIEQLQTHMGEALTQYQAAGRHPNCRR